MLSAYKQLESLKHLLKFSCIMSPVYTFNTYELYNMRSTPKFLTVQSVKRPETLNRNQSYGK